ncbi:MAG: hypothetical protein V1909_02035 [Candidatus Micrarchaeota archaeon]
MLVAKTRPGEMHLYNKLPPRDLFGTFERPGNAAFLKRDLTDGHSSRSADRIPPLKEIEQELSSFKLSRVKSMIDRIGLDVRTGFLPDAAAGVFIGILEPKIREIETYAANDPRAKSFWLMLVECPTIKFINYG